MRLYSLHFRDRALELPPSIEEKIEYNNVILFKDNFHEAFNYVIIIDEMIENLNRENASTSNLIPWSINQRYRNIRQKKFLEHNINSSNNEHVINYINSHADEIINEIKKTIEDDIPSIEGASIEVLRFCILLIVCHGFITCNILERPIRD